MHREATPLVVKACKDAFEYNAPRNAAQNKRTASHLLDYETSGVHYKYGESFFCRHVQIRKRKRMQTRTGLSVPSVDHLKNL